MIKNIDLFPMKKTVNISSLGQHRTASLLSGMTTQKARTDELIDDTPKEDRDDTHSSFLNANFEL